MKNLILNPVSLILLSILSFTLPTFGGNKDSLHTIEMDGKVFISENDESKFYQMELISDNTVLETGIVVDGENFLLRLKKNSLYTVRITKEGYSPLVVSINTSLPGYDNKQYYRFDNSYFLSLHGFTMSLSLQNQDQLALQQ